MYKSAWIDEYGKPLGPLDDEKLNGAKPLRIQDQIVTDENGKRRFHGAFTGGFSAGYWNTVGSQEGWTPQNFKSSRATKAAPLEQKPLDFMDEEDLEEFGNAPLSLQDRDEDPTIITKDEIDLKRVLNLNESKIIAATAPEREAKKAEREKRKAAEYNKRKLYVLQKYGCDTGNADNVWHSVAEDDINAAFEPVASEEKPIEPLEFENYVQQPEPQAHKFDLGDYTAFSSEEPPSDDKKAPPVFSKILPKLAIKGHAFGVGALEEDDDDIYEKEDMSNYDFSLENRKKRKQRIIKMLVKDEASFSGQSESTSAEKESDATQTIPESNQQIIKEPDDLLERHEKRRKIYGIEKPTFLKPRPWVDNKSSYVVPITGEVPIEKKEFVENNEATALQVLATQSGTHSKLDQPSSIYQSTEESKKQKLLDLIGSKSSNFVRAGELHSVHNEEKTKELVVEIADSTKKIEFPLAISTFKPFAYDESKQNRYEQFVAANVCSEKDIGDFLCKIQPAKMSQWDREMEKKEFIQSRKLYKPLEGIMANRFVTETIPETLVATAAPKDAKTNIKDVKKVISIVRSTMVWKPTAQLCKRYNIAEPITDGSNDRKNQLKHSKKPQLSVFDYLEGSIHTKSNFVTPVIIPKHVVKPEEIIKSALNARNHTVETPNASTPNVVAPARTSRWNVEPSKEENSPISKVQHNNISNEKRASAEPLRLTFVPKTERMKEKDLPPAEEKQGLFQAIFSDNEEEADENSLSKKPAVAATNLADQMYSTKTTVSSIASANLIRNMSPPRGIFAALFTAKPIEEPKHDAEVTADEPPEKMIFKSRQDSVQEQPDNSYGPSMPVNLLKKPTTDTVKILKVDQLSKPAEQRIFYKGVQIIEKWVEPKDIISSDDSDINSKSSSSSEDGHRKHRKSKKSKKAKKSKKKSKKKHTEKRKTVKHKNKKE